MLTMRIGKICSDLTSTDPLAKPTSTFEQLERISGLESSPAYLQIQSVYQLLNVSNAALSITFRK